MTDDIVTRLIDEKVHQYEIKDFELGQLLKDAQDEIERQRLVITCLQNEVLRLAEIAWKAEAD